MTARAKSAKDGLGESYVNFECPGCKDHHIIPVTGARAWGFNGSFDRPTLTPSILARGKDWDEDADGNPCNARDVVCHSFVTNGRIEFLSDCTHAMAGQTVDLADIADVSE